MNTITNNNSCIQAPNRSIARSNTIPISVHDEILSHHTITGDFGEYYILRLLRNSGYKADKCINSHFSGDLCVTDTNTGEILKIEVKTANQDYRGRYNFCLHKPNKTNISYSDFVILVCVDENAFVYLYAMSASCFNGATFCTISSHPSRYAGKYSTFRLRSKIIDFDEIRATCRLWSGL